MLRAIRKEKSMRWWWASAPYMLTSAEAASNQLRGTALAQVSDAVITVDNDSRVTWLNAAAERFTRCARRQSARSLVAGVYECRWSERKGSCGPTVASRTRVTGAAKPL